MLTFAGANMSVIWWVWAARGCVLTFAGANMSVLSCLLPREASIFCHREKEKKAKNPRVVEIGTQ